MPAVSAKDAFIASTAKGQAAQAFDLAIAVLAGETSPNYPTLASGGLAALVVPVPVGGAGFTILRVFENHEEALGTCTVTDTAPPTRTLTSTKAHFSTADIGSVITLAGFGGPLDGPFTIISVPSSSTVTFVNVNANAGASGTYSLINSKRGAVLRYPTSVHHIR